MKPMNDDIPVEALRECFRFDDEAGVLYWKERPRAHFKTQRGCSVWNSKYAGKAAGNSDARGAVHVAISIDGNEAKPHAHRIIWAMFHGEWPTKEIDHIDCNPANNRLDNLRLAERGQNLTNIKVRSNNKSGFKGVWLHAPGQWRSCVKKAGKRLYLGVFASPEEAHSAYCAAAKNLHGEFARG